MPQAPQFWESVSVFAQKVAGALPQSVGVTDGHEQVEPAQAWPAGQTVPHAPQLFASTARLAQ